MARIRSIKPEFFTSADVVSLTPLARLFYVSLWCEADREGRLKWDVLTLKMRYLPADDCDIEELASELEERELIVIYEVDGKLYAEIPSFKTHQVINNREAESVLPARVKGASVRVLGEGRKEGKGKEGKEGTKTNCADDKPSTPPCPHQEIIDLYHEYCPTGTVVRVWNETRSKHLQARWREDPKRQDLEWWRKFFLYCSESAFLSSRVPPPAGRQQFVISLDWIVNPTNFAKIIEGRYHSESAA